MSKKQGSKSENTDLQEDDPVLLSMWFSLKDGKIEINREAIGRALLNPDTHVTAITILTLFHYFVDKETFLKGMKKTAENIDKTMEKIDQHLSMIENLGKSLH